VIYADHVKRGQPHMRKGKGSFAWLNNNPGNLTKGKVNVGEFERKPNWHNFVIFPTPQEGFDAIPRFLKVYGFLPMSIAAAFERYAPKKDGNDPDRYAREVVAALGRPVTLDTKLGTLTDDQMLEVQRAIKRMEGWVPGDTLWRDDASIPEAIRSRL
jgi:hypothetical protein